MLKAQRQILNLEIYLLFIIGCFKFGRQIFLLGGNEFSSKMVSRNLVSTENYSRVLQIIQAIKSIENHQKFQ
jgi:hypothetical protein